MWIATQYSLKDRALDVFFAGCHPPHCPGCHNPELQKFHRTDYSSVQLVNRIKHGDEMIDRIRLMGGEPLDQDLHDILKLLTTLRTAFPKKELWVFTKYLPEELTPEMKEILKQVHFVKYGRFMLDFPGYTCPTTGIQLASGNQFVRQNVDAKI